MAKQCIDCGKPISKRAIRCKSCAHKGSANPNWQGGLVECICKYCGKKFTVSQSKADKGASFCSRVCMGKWQSENWIGENNPHWQGGGVILKCEWCGKEFEVAQHRAGSRFCSYACMGKWESENYTGNNNPNWRGGELRSCEVCGRKFKVSPSRIGLGWGRFCSTACMGKWHSEIRVGDNNPNWRGGKIAHQCRQCGREFWIFPSSTQDQFCSQACCGQWCSENMCGENSPHWKGGLSFEPYGLEWTKELRRYIRKRDNHICAICGKQGKCVHHIDYDKQNNSPENLVTLDRACHSRTNANRRFWQIILAPIARKREQGVALPMGGWV